MEEIWRDIPEYKGLYKINNLGQVKSLINNKLLKCWMNSGGYCSVKLCLYGLKKNHVIHRLVAKAFIPNPENKTQVDHINTIRADNRVENLRWVTEKENSNNPLTVLHLSNCKKGMKLSFETKKKCSISHIGKKHSLSTKVKLGKEVMCLEKNLRFYAIREASRILNVSHSSINQVLSGKRKTAGGFHWKYI